MVDRILHIGHKLAAGYDKELLQRAAEVYIYKGPAAVVPHLTTNEKMDAAEAARLFQNIDAEMRRVNRQVVLQYAVLAVPFLVLVAGGVRTHSFVFAGFFAVPALLLLYALVKFLRRNPVRSARR